MFKVVKVIVPVMGLVVLAGCATAPTIEVPQTVREIKALKTGGRQGLVQMPDFTNCTALKNASHEEIDYDKRLLYAKIRTRCVQQQLANKLTKMKNLEIGTRAGLQILALGASAAGLFGGSDDLIAALGLSAGAVAGIRAFQPLETRDRLYFYAIGALECSIMTADTLAREGENGFAKQVFESLLDHPLQGNSNDREKKLSESKLLPLELAKKIDPSTSVREILYKRMRLMESGKSDEKDVTDVHDMYAPYLRSDSSFEKLYIPDVNGQNGRAGQTNSKVLVPTLTSLPLSNPIGKDTVDPIIASLLTTNVAKVAMTSQQTIESFTTWFRATNDAVRHAPETLENATTLIALAVNKALVDEQPDVQVVKNAADKATQDIFGTVKANRERFKVLEIAQEQQMETALENGQTLQGTIEGQPAASDKKAANKNAVGTFNKAMEDIKVTKAILDGIVRLTEARSDQPAECRALFNGTSVANDDT